MACHGSSTACIVIGTGKDGRRRDRRRNVQLSLAFIVRYNTHTSRITASWASPSSTFILIYICIRGNDQYSSGWSLTIAAKTYSRAARFYRVQIPRGRRRSSYTSTCLLQLSVMGYGKAGRKCNGMKFDPTPYVYNVLYGNNIADSPAKPGQNINWSVWNSILLLCTSKSIPLT